MFKAASIKIPTLLFFLAWMAFSCAEPEKIWEHLGVSGDLEMLRHEIRIPLDEQSLPEYKSFSSFEKGKRHLFYGFNPKSRAIDVFDLDGKRVLKHISVSELENQLEFKTEQIFVFNELDIFLYGSNKLIRIDDLANLKEYHPLNSSYALDGGKSKPEVNGFFRLNYIAEQDSVYFVKKFENWNENDNRALIARYELHSRQWFDVPVEPSPQLMEIDNLPEEHHQLVFSGYKTMDAYIFGYLFDHELLAFQSHQTLNKKHPRPVFAQESYESLPEPTADKSLLKAYYLLNPQFFMPLEAGEFVVRPYWKQMELEQAKTADFTDKGLYLSVLDAELNVISDFPLEPYRYGINNWFGSSKGIFMQKDHPLLEKDHDYLVLDWITWSRKGA